ncbi:putative von Willebrand factor A domain-containing [Sesbania bispinosa]|nr:putative von Willebrand factor A domain-containing [Sesbania bispinosa]
MTHAQNCKIHGFGNKKINLKVPKALVMTLVYKTAAGRNGGATPLPEHATTS